MNSTEDAFAGHRMTEEAVDDLLSRVGVGVLSLARDGEAYGIPVSYGYDGEATIYVVFVGYGETSRKETFAAATERASLAVVETNASDDWRSVIVDGRLVEVDRDEWPAAREAIEATAWYPDLFRTAEPTRDLQIWALRIDERSGLAADR
jgi:hypothetical protein